MECKITKIDWKSKLFFYKISSQNNYKGCWSVKFMIHCNNRFAQGKLLNFMSMENHHFVAEYEFKASRKMLYPYLNTAGGLAQWFADDANIDEDHLFSFVWDEEEHKARLAAQRLNRFVKFEFFDHVNGSPHEHLPYIEMQLDENDLTGTVFLKVTDTATTDDEEEFKEIWRQLTDTLKEIVGG